MNVHFSQTAVEGLFGAPLPVQKAFIKQINYLVRNLNHPSLRAKKFDEAKADGRPASTTIGAFTLLSNVTPTASARSSLIQNSLWPCKVTPQGHPITAVRQSCRMSSRFRPAFKGVGASADL